MGSERMFSRTINECIEGRYFRPRRKLITGQGYVSLISVDNGRVIMKEH